MNGKIPPRAAVGTFPLRHSRTGVPTGSIGISRHIPSPLCISFCERRDGMAEQKVFPHRLSLNERKDLTVTGVTEVVSFDEEAVILKTSLGTLNVHGQQLQLKTLSTNGGQVEISGTIDAMIYQQNKPEGGWLRRLFG